MNKFAGMNSQLRKWFWDFRQSHPEFHTSCAGRGAADQEAAKAAGASRADYGESAHNYNCALDLFIQLPQVDLYDKKRFNDALLGKLPYFLNWYGEPKAVFHELPHIEIRAWRGMIAASEAHLVEPKSVDFEKEVV